MSKPPLEKPRPPLPAEADMETGGRVEFEADIEVNLEEDDIEDGVETDFAGLAARLEVGRLVTAPPAWALARPDIAAKLQDRSGHRRPALTGGIASGKTAVAEMLVGRGAGHIDFDLLARRAVAPGSPGLAAAIELLGPEFLTPEGGLNRPRTAAAIFSDQALKAGLENIIHPITWELMGAELDELGARPVVVVSVPLLFEAGMETFFSPIIMVFADAATQRARLMARGPHLSAEVAQAIIDSQWPAPPKIMGSTFIIDNSGALAETARQTEAVWRALNG